MRKLITLLALSLAGCGAAGRICAGTGADPGTSFVSAVPLGAAVDWSHVRDSPAYARFFLEHYSWMTPENELKMDALEPAAGKFDFHDADAMVNWARAHGKHVHGHVLVYGSQLPGWLQLSGGLEATQALRVMTTYIDTVMRHFRGRIGEWDVVNERLRHPAGGTRTFGIRRWDPAT